MTLTKTPLTAAQSARKAELETIISTGLSAYQKSGEALKAIRDEQLYLDEHETFEEYCKERWGFTRQRGYQLIGAAETAKSCQTLVDIPTERGARALKKLEPASQATVAKTLGQAGQETEADDENNRG